MDLSCTLKALRKERGLSQEELATATGLSVHSINSYESGRRTPNSKAMATLERFFQVSGEYLRGDSDDRNPEYRWDDPEIVEAISKNLPVLLNGLYVLLKKCTDEDRDNAFTILQELGHVLKLEDPERRTACLTLFQNVFGPSTLFLDACLNADGDLDPSARLERTKSRTQGEYEMALNKALAFFLQK